MRVWTASGEPLSSSASSLSKTFASVLGTVDEGGKVAAEVSKAVEVDVESSLGTLAAVGGGESDANVRATGPGDKPCFPSAASGSWSALTMLPISWS